MVTADKQEVDKRALYGKFEEGEERRAQKAKRRENFFFRVAHKANDMAMEDEDDPMQITNTKNGVGTLGAVGIGAVASLPSLLTAAALYFGQGDKVPQQPAAPPVASTELTDSEYDVTLYNERGEVIPVKNITPELQKLIDAQTK